MLHDFITSNRGELIARCEASAARRFAPNDVPAAIAHGVPVFLLQMVEALVSEQYSTTRQPVKPKAQLGSTQIGRSAALHGAELLNLGFTMEQVVHDYGDVCQSITGMAVEQDVEISADEFRTMNRCIDNAIADSVTSFGRAREDEINVQADALKDVVAEFSRDHSRLIDIATQSFAAIRTGNIGVSGATGALLTHTLAELRELANRTLPEIRRRSANTKATAQ